MQLLKVGGFFSGKIEAGFPKQRIDEQSAAHANPPVNAPDGELDSRFLQRLAPGENMLIDAVYQRAIEVKQEGDAGQFRVFRPPLRPSALKGPVLASCRGHGISAFLTVKVYYLTWGSDSPRLTQGRWKCAYVLVFWPHRASCC